MVLVVAGQLALPPADEPLAAGLLAALGQARGAREAPWPERIWPVSAMGGSWMARGTGQCLRQVAARQARQYGVKTR